MYVVVLYECLKYVFKHELVLTNKIKKEKVNQTFTWYLIQIIQMKVMKAAIAENYSRRK